VAKKNSKKKGKTPVEDGVDLWNHVTKDINPIPVEKQNYFTVKPDSNPHPSHAGQHKTIPRPVRRRLVPENGGGKTTSKKTNTIMEHGHAPGLDASAKRRMRRGKMDIDATIDLHGMTKNKAYQALVKFIETAFQLGNQNILVITGKGLKNDGSVGVLRKSVPDWLNQPAIAPWIKGFSYAAPKHGGVGAIYVMLRRRK